MCEVKWGKIREAVEYYEMSQMTVHRYRREGIIESRPAYNGNRIGYEYLLDPELKEKIDEKKIVDNRWG